jgi:hypothetical protein
MSTVKGELQIYEETKSETTTVAEAFDKSTVKSVGNSMKKDS